MVTPADTSQPNSTRELILAGVWLTCTVVLVLPGSLWWGYHFAGQPGMVASALAAWVCWVASILAHGVRTRFTRPQEVVPAGLGAILIRMVLVFGGGVLIASVSPQLVKAALWGQLIFYFFVTLTVETLLAIQWVKKLDHSSAAKGSDEQSSLSESGAKAV